jgi:CUE domain
MDDTDNMLHATGTAMVENDAPNQQVVESTATTATPTATSSTGTTSTFGLRNRRFGRWTTTRGNPTTRTGIIDDTDYSNRTEMDQDTSTSTTIATAMTTGTSTTVTNHNNTNDILDDHHSHPHATETIAIDYNTTNNGNTATATATAATMPTTATTTTNATTNTPRTASPTAATTATTSTTAWKQFSRYYCRISTLGAMCAIVIAPTNTIWNGSSSRSSRSTTGSMKDSNLQKNLPSNTMIASSSRSEENPICLASSIATELSTVSSSSFSTISKLNDVERNNDPHEEIIQEQNSNHKGWSRWLTQPQSTTNTNRPDQNVPIVVPHHHKNEAVAATTRQQEQHNNYIWKSIVDTALFRTKGGDTTTNDSTNVHKSNSTTTISYLTKQLLFSWLDPNLVSITFYDYSSNERSHINHPSTNTHDCFDTLITNLIDKVLTSTVRLILIANWLIALTVLLHMAVADYFLGGNVRSRDGQRRSLTGSDRRTTTPATTTTATPNNNNTTTTRTTTATTATSTGSRERVSGFLLFKFLLISSMVAPDTFDLLILLSWYTALSFLRSLASLCIQRIDTCRLLLHTIPPVGVMQLLCTVLCLDVMAAMTCIGLFHGAGYGMVLLLTCDCILLAFDTISHMIQYYQSIIDVQHTNSIQAIDDQQMILHHQVLQRQQSLLSVASVSESTGNIATTTTSSNSLQSDENNHQSILERSKDLDRQMEALEQQHNRTSSKIESIVFLLQLLIDILTMLHFIHIWTLHGIHFTFIDGVIALHLHSATTSALKKIRDRQASYRIARDMDTLFPNATEHELQIACDAGDVCSICLGTMNYFTTNNKTDTGSNAGFGRVGDQKTTYCSPQYNVKKVACGHLYHTSCLREVIERARSMEAARCPLCRAQFIPPKQEQRQNQPAIDATTGTRPNPTTSDANGDLSNTLRRDSFAERRNDDTNVGNNNNAGVAVAVVAEDSIFRFTTEGLFPDWIPIPGFSFEIVRRPSPTPTIIGAANGNDDTNAVRAIDAVRLDQQPPQREVPNPIQPQPEQSLFRRIMLLAGMVQMSPEEELMALEQLVDMFPQYERHDLQRALRQRGTIEAVVESILVGVFIGVPHGGGGG